MLPRSCPWPSSSGCLCQRVLNRGGQRGSLRICGLDKSVDPAKSYSGWEGGHAWKLVWREPGKMICLMVYAPIDRLIDWHQRHGRWVVMGATTHFWGEPNPSRSHCTPFTGDKTWWGSLHTSGQSQLGRSSRWKRPWGWRATNRNKGLTPRGLKKYLCVCFPECQKKKKC